MVDERHVLVWQEDILVPIVVEANELFGRLSLELVQT
jgi:hypothetical protein